MNKKKVEMMLKTILSSLSQTVARTQLFLGGAHHTAHP